MSDNQISSFLTISLILLVCVFFVLLVILVVLMLKEKSSQKRSYTGNKDLPDEDKKVKKDVEYNKNSIFEFMEFDKVEDNMIIRKKGKQFIMVIECQGVNYDLMSGLEKNSVEQGFLQFLNTLRYPIQLYIQTRTVNLGSSINRYREKLKVIRDEYLKKQMEYNSMVNLNDEYSAKEINNARYELIKAQNLYEYGLDIVNNTEKMNLNKNILKKHYYVIISYIPEENNNTVYDEEVKNMAFSDLYTRAQALISSLSVCDVSGKVLDSEELAELLYIAYNRDESETYQLDNALKAGVDELYSTAKNVLDKRMEEINAEIQAKANIEANDAAVEAMMNQDKLRRAKQKEERMNQLIEEVAKDLLDENEEILGEDVVKEAKKIVSKKAK